jgi:hypothetical protein
MLLSQNICNDIEVKDLFIDHDFHTIRMFLTFTHCGHPYIASFRFMNAISEWNLVSVEHSIDIPCQKCSKFLPPGQRDNFLSDFFKHCRDVIQNELLADPVVLEKLKIFRLEALTNGYNY